MPNQKNVENYQKQSWSTLYAALAHLNSSFKTDKGCQNFFKNFRIATVCL